MNSYVLQGIQQVAKARSVPRSVVLGGLLILTSFFLSPVSVTIPETDWIEPAFVWITISMPTGSRKSSVYSFLQDLIHDIRKLYRCHGVILNVC